MLAVREEAQMNDDGMKPVRGYSGLARYRI